MQDLHKPNYLDAKMELGTQVQFFSFTLNDVCLYNVFIGSLMALIIFLMPNYYKELFCFYMGVFAMLIFFYIKFGTN